MMNYFQEMLLKFDLSFERSRRYIALILIKIKLACHQY